MFTLHVRRCMCTAVSSYDICCQMESISDGASVVKVSSQSSVDHLMRGEINPVSEVLQRSSVYAQTPL